MRPDVRREMSPHWGVKWGATGFARGAPRLYPETLKRWPFYSVFNIPLSGQCILGLFHTFSVSWGRGDFSLPVRSVSAGEVALNREDFGVSGSTELAEVSAERSDQRQALALRPGSRKGSPKGSPKVLAKV